MIRTRPGSGKPPIG